MTHEYQRQSLEQLITQQTATPRSAAVVFNENQTLWQTLGFSQSQVSLWLASLPQSNHLFFVALPLANCRLFRSFSEYLVLGLT